MARFVPKNKLSKKAQKEMNRQRRAMWDFSHITKTVDSKKLYNRKRNARDQYDDNGASVILYLFNFPVIAYNNFSNSFASPMTSLISKVDMLRNLCGSPQVSAMIFAAGPMRR